MMEETPRTDWRFEIAYAVLRRVFPGGVVEGIPADQVFAHLRQGLGDDALSLTERLMVTDSKRRRALVLVLRYQMCDDTPVTVFGAYYLPTVEDGGNSRGRLSFVRPDVMKTWLSGIVRQRTPG